MEPRSLTIYQTQTAVFQCEAAAGEVSWLKNGRSLQLDQRMTVLPSGGLEIRNVNIPDRGSYSCTAGTLVSRTAELHLKALVAKAGPEPPVFLLTPRGRSVLVGSRVTLECSANGLPQPNLTWLKDGREIELELVDTRYVRTGSGSLTINNVRLEDEGGYQCRAENTEDSQDSGVQLRVNLAPSLVTAPADNLSYEKDDILFDCQVSGRPEPEVKWYKNGDLIIQSEYFQLVRGTSLKILGLVSSDAGIYQCIATNTVGSVQAAAQLQVKTKGKYNH